MFKPHFATLHCSKQSSGSKCIVFKKESIQFKFMAKSGLFVFHESRAEGFFCIPDFCVY